MNPVPNKSFCVAPWTTIHALPDGNAYPCCLWDFRDPTGDLKKNTFNEVAHNERMNDLRRRMLAGEVINGCLDCNNRNTERDVNWTSVKDGYNSLFKNRIPEFIENTNPDGSLKKPFEMRLLNVRFSNLCNYSCRSCNQWLSSVIAQENNLPFPSNLNDPVPNALEQVLKEIDTIDYINMAGGEPLLVDAHWIIMDELIRRGRTNVRIDMFTNMGKLVHKSHDLIAYAKKFPKFKIYASIDAMGDRAEIYRNGTHWPTVETNLKKVVAEGLDMEYSVTVGATNIWHIPDLHAWLVENGLLDVKKPSKFRLHNVVRPAHIGTKIIPRLYKEKIKAKIDNYVAGLINKDMYHGGWDFLTDFMMSEDHTYLLPKFREHHANLDKLRKTNIYDAFPEIVEWSSQS